MKNNQTVHVSDCLTSSDAPGGRSTGEVHECAEGIVMVMSDPEDNVLPHSALLTRP